MRKRGWIVVLAAGSLFHGCRREAAPPAPAVTPEAPPPAAVAAPTGATESVGRVELLPQEGRLELGFTAQPTGEILRGMRARQFTAGTPFTLAVRTDGLKPGVDIEARWIGPGDVSLANETKTMANAAYVDFVGPSSESSPGGQYRVEVWIEGKLVGGIDFTIDAATRPGV